MAKKVKEDATALKSFKVNLDKAIKAIEAAAKEFDVHGNDVTKTQFHAHCDISDWDLRKLGGLSSIKKLYFPVTDKDLAGIVERKKTSSYISKLEKQVGERINLEEKLLTSFKESLASMKIAKIKVPKYTAHKNKPNMTMEAMISDVHVGKKTSEFNLEVCRLRIREFMTVFATEVKENEKIFNVERFILALLGDMIESYTMHGQESALSCEMGNSPQIKEAIEMFFLELIVPMASLGRPIDVPAIAGNHDRVEKEKTMNNPGENNVTWVIYNALELLCKAAGLKNVIFYIPKSSHHVLNVYGSNILYEHGDRLKSTAKDVFENLIRKRSNQLGIMIHMARFGHWHEYICYGRGRIIVNESVPGQDSYAKEMGFNSDAGQTINYYIETKERPNCFYKSFPVYLGKTA